MWIHSLHVDTLITCGYYPSSYNTCYTLTTFITYGPNDISPYSQIMKDE